MYLVFERPIALFNSIYVTREFRIATLKSSELIHYYSSICICTVKINDDIGFILGYTWATSKFLSWSIATYPKRKKELYYTKSAELYKIVVVKSERTLTVIFFSNYIACHILTEKVQVECLFSSIVLWVCSYF